jgi:hypothetical protein
MSGKSTKIVCQNGQHIIALSERLLSVVVAANTITFELVPKPSILRDTFGERRTKTHKDAA